MHQTSFPGLIVSGNSFLSEQRPESRIKLIETHQASHAMEDLWPKKVEDHPHKIWYSLDGGMTNVSVDHSRLNTYTIINQTLWYEIDYGMVNITFYAEDAVGSFAFVIVEVEKVPEYYQREPTNDDNTDMILIYGFFGLLIALISGAALLYKKFSGKLF